MDKWLNDLPQQFQGKPNIEVLIKAISRQLQEIFNVFNTINSNTDLGTAIGQNLDYVGTIIPLTRKEAVELTEIISEEPSLSDERYRQYLRYQLLRNTSECTYYDLMKGMELLWDVKPVFYEEDPALPATIILTMPFLKPGGEAAVLLGEVPMIKPAGVGLAFLYYIRIIVETAYSLLLSIYDIPRCNTLVCGTHPHTATLGIIQAVIQESNIGITITTYDSKVSGTIRIGGKKWDATLGNSSSIHIIMDSNTKIQVLELLQSGIDVAGIYPLNAVQGLFSFVDNIVRKQISMDLYDTLSTGTIQIGGKEYPAAIGKLQNENGMVEISISGGLTIEELIRTGKEAAGTYPENVLEATAIYANKVRNIEQIIAKEHNLPATGRLTIGGSELADVFYAKITSGMETDLSIIAAVPEQVVASTKKSCGSGVKTTKEIRVVETKAAILSASVTIQRCGSGNARCGKK